MRMFVDCVRNRVLLLSVFVLGCTPLRAARPTPPLRDYSLDMQMSRLDLGNGALAFLAAEPNADLVTMHIRYHVGAADDPPGKEGMAHLAEHLLFEAKLGNRTLGEVLESKVVSNNAFTSADNTTYITRFEPSQFRDTVRLEAARISIRCGSVSDDTFAAEREVVANEVLQRGTNSDIRSALFPGHPYGRPVGGSAESVRSITKAEVCKFIDEHYAPNNATIVIVGNVSAEDAATALQPYSSLTQREFIKQAEFPKLQAKQPKQTLRTSFEQPGLVLAWRLQTNDTQAIARGNTVGRMIAAMLDTIDDDIDAASMELGGDRATYFAIVLVGRSKTIAQLEEFAKKHVGKLDYWTKNFGFQRALEGAMTEYLRNYDDVDGRIEMIYNHIEQGHHPSTAMLEEVKTINGLTSAQSQKSAIIDFAYDDASILRLEPMNRFQKLLQHAKQRQRGESSSAAAVQTPVTHFDRSFGDVSKDADSPMAEVVRRDRLGVITERQLANGLTVITAPNSSVPLVHATLIIHSGNNQEPAGKKGVATFARWLESKASYVEQLKIYSAGASVNSFTGEESTVFTTSGSSSYIDYILQGLSNVVVDGGYDETELASTLKRWAKETTPADKLRGQTTSTLWSSIVGSKHPSATSGIEGLFDLKAIGVNDVKRFRKQHFVPANATLIVTGAFDPNTVDDWIRYTFSHWQGKRAPAEKQGQSSASTAFAIESEGQQSQIEIYLANPDTDMPLAARRIIGWMLEQASAEVRQTLASTYGIHASYQYLSSGGFFSTTGEVDTSKLAASFELLSKTIDSLGDDSAASKSRFVRARATASQNAAGDPSSGEQLGNLLYSAVEQKQPIASFGQLPSQIAKMTYSDIKPWLAKVLDPANRVVRLWGDKASVTAAYAKVGKSPTWLDWP